MQKLTFKSFQWRWTIFIALGITLIGMGASVQGISLIFTITATAFMAGGGMLVMVGLIYCLPSSNSLEINDGGFSYRNGLKTVFCRWEDCGEFTTWHQNLFGLTASELVTFDTKTPIASANSNLKTTGKNGVLPGTYGMDADELVAKLNQFRSHYVSSQPATTQPAPQQVVAA